MAIVFAVMATAFSAQAETLIIKQNVYSGLPAQPPTAPNVLTAQATSFSQINLAWLGATDNLGIAGYVVFRDGSAVATTSGTASTFSDTSLSPETTYSYFVQAFNYSGLYSSSSPTATATTLALNQAPVSVIVVPSSQSGGMLLRIYDFQANTRTINGRNQIVVNFDTNLDVAAQLKYGRDFNFSDGSLSRTVYGRHHSFLIDNVLPGKMYYLGLELRAIGGQIYALDPIPLAVGETSVPGPDNLRFVKEAGGLRIRWDNPPTADYQYILLLRSNIFYPTDRWSGIPLSRGRVNNFLDQDIKVGETYYYAVFACDAEDRCSSGTYVGAKVGTTGPLPIREIIPNTIFQSSLERLIGVVADEPFYLSAQGGGERVIIAHIFDRQGKWLSSYRLAPNEFPDSLVTARIVIRQPGDYYYQIEEYDFSGAAPLSLDRGLIRVSPRGEKDKIMITTEQLWWWLLSALLVLIVYRSIKRYRERDRIIVG